MTEIDESNDIGDHDDQEKCGTTGRYYRRANAPTSRILPHHHYNYPQRNRFNGCCFLIRYIQYFEHNSAFCGRLVNFDITHDGLLMCESVG